ncbi:extracellular solute-binding protein [Salinibacterium sp. SWN248]|uniref:extracellular solute-binding protein n=1 Tax=Salinibacterium sp. SWN248 TaxID=2792056 RepID=UPI0018CFA1CD|nr:extracellular solute-binding protein [Salinibacterium sp. SWN248]MBH0023064.1 extracellular solute-binding protein [Salinibacterium sp. SWN248]
MSRPSWRATAATALAIGVALGTIGCSSDSTGASGSGVSVWTTSGTESVLMTSQEQHNAEEGSVPLDVQVYENDPYKTKLRTAISAGQGPTVFSGWGGGGLAAYVEAGEVESLQAAFDAAPELRDRIFPSVLAGGTIDGEIYGTPYNGVQPVVIYYNENVFADNGVKVPETWDETMDAVAAFKAEGITPFSIGGAGRWPYLMWIAYLTDRIGGPEVFDAVVAGEEGAWEDPAIVTAASMIQDLVEAGGFGDGFSSVDPNQGAPEALVYTGRAAMQLQGAWGYSSAYLSGDPEFVEDGLGWTTFPSVEGGLGDPSNVTGNLSAFFSVSSKADAETKKAATDWLVNGVFDDDYIDGLIGIGAVPPVSGIEDKIAAAPAADWNTFVYKTAQNAGNFQLSWDQAISPEEAEVLLTNLEKLFLLEITPDEFASNMNAAA